jgi:hypothetical protein
VRIAANRFGKTIHGRRRVDKSTLGAQATYKEFIAIKDKLHNTISS